MEVNGVGHVDHDVCGALVERVGNISGWVGVLVAHGVLCVGCVRIDHVCFVVQETVCQRNEGGEPVKQL